MIMCTPDVFAFDPSELLGYTLVSEKRIDGDFEGCDFDKKIIFMDGTYLTCATYSYTYSYMPTAYIYAKHLEYKGKVFADIKMVVGDRVYDMYPISLGR
jgi:hypothetical protein